jgi:hypothetical protein
VSAIRLCDPAPDSRYPRAQDARYNHRTVKSIMNFLILPTYGG